MSFSRRDFLASTAAAAMFAPGAKGTPVATVSMARARTYNPVGLTPTMERLFDGIGGLGRIVKNKTVAIKVNLTGAPNLRMGHYPLGWAQWTHPTVLGVVVSLMDKAGAKRIRILESPWSTADPLEEYMLEGNWEPMDFVRAGAKVEFENTNYLGNAKKYSRFAVPKGGHLFTHYDLNHSYEDCDVFCSLAKLKEHATAGVTLSMKNCFGMTPCTIYGDGAGVDEPSVVPKGGRGTIFHAGKRGPAKSSVQEKNPGSPRDDKYRIPRAVADLVAARPIDLAIVDGIESMAGGEGPWIKGVRHCSPGVLIAGTNCVNTDAVGTAVMGFDPMADRGRAPFETCDSTLRLAEELGVGSRDLSRIEVAGLQIADARFEIRKS